MRCVNLRWTDDVYTYIISLFVCVYVCVFGLKVALSELFQSEVTVISHPPP